MAPPSRAVAGFADLPAHAKQVGTDKANTYAADRPAPLCVMSFKLGFLYFSCRTISLAV